MLTGIPRTTSPASNLGQTDRSIRREGRCWIRRPMPLRQRECLDPRARRALVCVAHPGPALDALAAEAPASPSPAGSSGEAARLGTLSRNSAWGGSPAAGAGAAPVSVAPILDGRTALPRVPTASRPVAVSAACVPRCRRRDPDDLVGSSSAKYQLASFVGPLPADGENERFHRRVVSSGVPRIQCHERGQGEPVRGPRTASRLPGGPRCEQRGADSSHFRVRWKSAPPTLFASQGARVLGEGAVREPPPPHSSNVSCWRKARLERFHRTARSIHWTTWHPTASRGRREAGP